MFSACNEIIGGNASDFQTSDMSLSTMLPPCTWALTDKLKGVPILPLGFGSF